MKMTLSGICATAFAATVAVASIGPADAAPLFLPRAVSAQPSDIIQVRDGVRWRGTTYHGNGVRYARKWNGNGYRRGGNYAWHNGGYGHYNHYYGHNNGLSVSGGALIVGALIGSAIANSSYYGGSYYGGNYYGGNYYRQSYATVGGSHVTVVPAALPLVPDQR